MDRQAMDREHAVARLVQEMRGEALGLRRELGEVVAAVERVRSLMVRVLVTGAVVAVLWPVAVWCVGRAVADG